MRSTQRVKLDKECGTSIPGDELIRDEEWEWRCPCGEWWLDFEAAWKHVKVDCTPPKGATITASKVRR